MFWASLSIALLLSAAAILFLNIKTETFKKSFKQIKVIGRLEERKKTRGKKIPLKKQIDVLVKGKKQNFFVRTFRETESILTETHQKSMIGIVYVVSFFLGVVGVLVSLLSKNVFMVIPMVLGAALIPNWGVRLSASKAKKKLNSMLEVALSGITTSYLRSDSIIAAIEENLVYLENPLKPIMVKFVNENKLINSNVALGIQKMEQMLDNEIFKEWCDALKQCQTDRSLKSTLFPIITKFSETRAIQTELDTMMMTPFKDTISIVVIVILSVPLMYMLNREWYYTLSGTVPGKIILALTVGVVVYAINKSVALTAPIRRGDK